jgi:5-methylcytosine-specific restriction enzyme A
MRKVLRVTSREAIQNAIAEHEELGREAFLSKYGFGTSTKYFLQEAGKLFDSKAIVGVAFGYQFPREGPLANTEFSGGDRTVARVLKSLGFTVVVKPDGFRPEDENVARRRNPNWTRDELILALELYFRVNPVSTSESNPEIVALSQLLNRLPIHVGRADAGTFRNPNGVYMKLCNFLRLDPEYKGVGLTSGGRLEEQIWMEFAPNRDLLNAVAERIKAAADVVVGESINDVDDEGLDEAIEGQVLTRVHRIRERNHKLVLEKKRLAMKRAGGLTCEVCGFDFVARYGIHGKDFIECHHTLPLSLSRPGQKTKTAELALVCANCHRMLHRGPRWLSLAELKEMLR